MSDTGTPKYRVLRCTKPPGSPPSVRASGEPFLRDDLPIESVPGRTPSDVNFLKGPGTSEEGPYRLAFPKRFAAKAGKVTLPDGTPPKWFPLNELVGAPELVHYLKAGETPDFIDGFGRLWLGTPNPTQDVSRTPPGVVPGYVGKSWKGGTPDRPVIGPKEVPATFRLVDEATQGSPEFLFPAQEKHFRDVAGTPRPKGTADPVILWLMERIRALEDRIRHPVLKVDDNQDRAIAMCIERIGDLEKKVRELESLLRVQTALMVDTRLAVKGLQKS